MRARACFFGRMTGNTLLHAPTRPNSAPRHTAHLLRVAHEHWRYRKLRVTSADAATCWRWFHGTRATEVAVPICELVESEIFAMTSEIVGKINSRTARIVVVGIGYVGLPLVVEFARAGFRVTGYDKDPEKARLLNEGESYIGDISSGDVAPLVRSRLLDATTDASVLREADVVIVCVPTPLNKTKEPDMRFIVSATDDIVAHQHAGMLVVLESTTYPGTTRELVCPRLSESGVVGRDIFVAFSPERVDPGNVRFGTRNTPRSSAAGHLPAWKWPGPFTRR